MQSHLHDGLAALDLEDLAGARGAVREREVDDLGELRRTHILQDHKRTVDALQRAVLEARLDQIVTGRRGGLNLRHGPAQRVVTVAQGRGAQRRQRDAAIPHGEQARVAALQATLQAQNEA